MARKIDARAVARIADIRKLQRDLAEGHAAKAGAVLRDIEQILQGREDAHSAIEAEWAASLSGPSLAVELLPSWGAMLQDHQSQVDRALLEKDTAAAELASRRHGFLRAERLHDDAAEAAADAQRRKRQTGWEAALSEASDQHARRRRVP